MTYKSILSLAIAAAFLGTIGLSSVASANGHKVYGYGSNRGGHVMGTNSGNGLDVGEVAEVEEESWEDAVGNVLYDEGTGNGSEDIDGNVCETADEGADYDPAVVGCPTE